MWRIVVVLGSVSLVLFSGGYRYGIFLGAATPDWYCGTPRLTCSLAR
jgi:hypothetical protein